MVASSLVAEEISRFDYSSLTAALIDLIFGMYTPIRSIGVSHPQKSRPPPTTKPPHFSRLMLTDEDTCGIPLKMNDLKKKVTRFARDKNYTNY